MEFLTVLDLVIDGTFSGLLIVIDKILLDEGCLCKPLLFLEVLCYYFVEGVGGN